MKSISPLRTGTRALIASTLVGVIVALGILGRPAPVEAQVSAMFPEVLKNLTYPSEFTVSGKAPLRDGKYDQRAALNDPLHPALVTYVVSVAKPEYGAVVLATNTGGSGIFSTLHLVRATNGVATAGPGLFLGDRVRIDKLGINEDGVLEVYIVTQGPGEALCCGTKLEERDYLPQDNGFRLVSVDGVAVGAPIAPRTGNLGATDRGESALALLTLAALTVVVTSGARRLTRQGR